MPSADWTRDANGKHVNWLKPPQRLGAIINFLLPGEHQDILDHATHSRRIHEYTLLNRREMRRGRQNVEKKVDTV